MKNKQFIIGIVIGIAVMFVYNSLLSGKALAPTVTTPSETATGSSESTGLTFPLAGFPVTSPATVAGSVMVFENQFMISVLDANGKELGQKRATSYGDIGMPAAFVEEVSFTKSSTPTGSIEIWDQSAKDGSKEVIDSVEIRFQ